jgi:NitT/TauT family transport system substrate-binding protein
VASPGVSSIQQVLLLYELQKYNMTAKDLDILSVNIFIIPNTLASHKVDAYIAYEPYVSLSPYRSIGKVLMYSNDIMPGHPCCVIIARQDYINQNPQELQKFLDIHKNTTEYINSHRNETAYLISKEMTTNPSLEEIALTHVVFVSQLDKEFQAKVMDFIKIEQELGFLKKNLTPEQIFDTRFLS